jgi:hypothetical protein
VCLIRERERWKQTDYSNEWENKDSLHILTESVCIQTYWRWRGRKGGREGGRGGNDWQHFVRLEQWLLLNTHTLSLVFSLSLSPLVFWLACRLFRLWLGLASEDWNARLELEGGGVRSKKNHDYSEFHKKYVLAFIPLKESIRSVPYFWFDWHLQKQVETKTSRITQGTALNFCSH